MPGEDRGATSPPFIVAATVVARLLSVLPLFPLGVLTLLRTDEKQTEAEVTE
ncbi:MAG: hypothetical protein LC781_12560 [Actinobacteria bacterium]|nr:hypothetical protein [Actinomycetota bacterium]